MRAVCSADDTRFSPIARSAPAPVETLVSTSSPPLGRKNAAARLRSPRRRGQPDAWDTLPGALLKTVQQRLQLAPALGARERMQLVDHDVAPIGE